MFQKADKRDRSAEDPAAVAERHFQRLEGRPAEPAAATAPAGDALLDVVRNLEAVTQSLIATSEALAAIARSLSTNS